jgi:hypothetical protein
MFLRREFNLDLKYEELDEFFKEVQSSIANKNIPKDYTISVHKDQAVCCGIFPIGVAIEIDGPEDKLTKELDIMTYSKIIEICEKKGIEYHESQPLEVL